MKRGRNMTYEKIFSDVQKNFKKAKISDFTDEFAFQFNITGEGEGIFYAAYKNGVLSVEPYDYLDRDVIFTADGKTLVDIASGKIEPIDAINGGKLFVDGNHELAKELMLLINHGKKAAGSSPAKKEAAAKTEPKKSVKPSAAKNEAKAVNAEAKTKSAAPAVKSEKPAEVKTAAKTETSPAVKTPEKPAINPVVKASEKPAINSAVKTSEKPTAKTASKTRKSGKKAKKA